MKYGVTANLTADLTVNTDFAQVEIDEQQVNLTRFNLFLPEKREFFLEGRGLFDFARGGASGGGNPAAAAAAPTRRTCSTRRRIGLNRNRVVPIDAGGRLTGKVGAFGIGVMNIQAGDEAVSSDAVHQLHRACASSATSCAAARIGAMFTNRNRIERSTAGGSNQAYGVDAALGFYQNVAIGGYYARTETTDLTGDNESYQGKFDWSPDRYGVSARSAEGREGLQSGSRLPAAHRLHALVRVGALQPAAEVVASCVRKYTYAGQLRVLRERRRRRRVAPGDRPVQRRVQQQRRRSTSKRTPTTTCC